MNPTYVMLIGSVGTGKTTIARSLVQYIRSKGYATYYVNLCVFHGFSYIIIAFVSTIARLLLGYRYIGNHYLTIWFNNNTLFRRIYNIVLLLEIPSIVAVYLIRILFKILLCKIQRKRCIIFIDEGLITGIAIHYYFSYFSKTKFFKYYYRIAMSILLWEVFRPWERIVVVLEHPIKYSIKAWIVREKTKIIDIDMIIKRRCVEKIILSYYLKNYDGLILYFDVEGINNIPRIARAIISALKL